MGRKKCNKVYRYFKIFKENNKSTCTLCNKTLNTNHGSNLLKHLKHTHKNEYSKIVELNNESSLSKNVSLSDNSQIIHKECLNLVTIHGRPMAMLDDQAFQNILSTVPDLNVTINSKNIKQDINDSAASLRMDMANELRNKMICIKVDIASLSTRSFMGVNAQYSKDGLIVIKNLAMIELLQRHTAEHLKEQIKFILQRFRIGLENIYSFTTDNGANMLKMIRLMSEEDANVPNTSTLNKPVEPSTSKSTDYHNNQTEILMTQEVSDIPKTANENNPSTSKETEYNNTQTDILDCISDAEYPGQDFDIDNNSIASKSDSYFDADVEFDYDYTENEYTETVASALSLELNVDNQVDGHRNIGIVRCAAHTLQLAILSALEEARIKEVLTSARNVVKRLLTQTYLNKIRHSKHKMPILDCVTRWNSTADMIERLIHLKPICGDQDLQTYLPESMWDTLKDFLNSLAPAKNLIIFLQAEQITLGDFYLQWLLCKINLNNINSKLSHLVIKYMTEREELLFQNDCFINAVFLDPRVNSTLPEIHKIRAKNNLIRLHHHLQKLTAKYNNNTDQELQSELVVVPRSKNNKSQLELDDFLNNAYLEKHDDLSVLLVKDNNRFTSKKNIMDEIDTFQKEPLLHSTNKIFDYWETKKHKFPCLYELSQVVLAAPASQVSVERLFSSLKFVVSKYRYNLKSDLIENILLIRNNAIYSKKKMSDGSLKHISL